MDTRHTEDGFSEISHPANLFAFVCLNSQQNEIKCKEQENTILPEYVGRFLQHALYQTFELHICALMSVNSSIVSLNCDRRFCNYNFQRYHLHLKNVRLTPNSRNVSSYLLCSTAQNDSFQVLCSLDIHTSLHLGAERIWNT